VDCLEHEVTRRFNLAYRIGAFRESTEETGMRALDAVPTPQHRSRRESANGTNSGGVCTRRVDYESLSVSFDGARRLLRCTALPRFFLPFLSRSLWRMLSASLCPLPPPLISAEQAMLAAIGRG
jgi:hypothetical protein